jgi:hypothetical protein
MPALARQYIDPKKAAVKQFAAAGTSKKLNLERCEGEDKDANTQYIDRDPGPAMRSYKSIE